jgi:threonine/homoserine/homoserine lactone efflux protein
MIIRLNLLSPKYIILYVSVLSSFSHNHLTVRENNFLDLKHNIPIVKLNYRT